MKLPHLIARASPGGVTLVLPLGITIVIISYIL